MLASSLRSSLASSVSVSLVLCQSVLMGTKRKFYAVLVGRKPGIYEDWEICKSQVNGFPKSEHKSFTTIEDAEEFMRGTGLKKQRITKATKATKAEPKVESRSLKQTLLRMPAVSTKAKKSKSSSFESKPINLGVRLSSSELDTAPEDYEQCVEPSKTESGSDPETEAAPVQFPTSLAADSESVSDVNLLYRLEYDGASKGNPGPAGAGALLRHPDGTVVCEVSVGLGKATNNVAEYRGLIAGMRQAAALGIQRIKAQGDSKLVAKQLDGTWKINIPTLRALCEEAKHLRKQFKEFQIDNVPREYNSAADALANKGVGLPEEKFDSPFPAVKKLMKKL